MKLLRVVTEINNGKRYERRFTHQVVETDDDYKSLERDLRMTAGSYGENSFSFNIEEENIEEITIDELKGLTLREVKKLLDSLT